MNRLAPRVIAVAIAATFAVAGCGRDDNRSSSANRPGSATGTTGGTASSPTTPGATPSPSGGGSAMSGGGASPSGSTGTSANGGTSSPSGTTGSSSATSSSGSSDAAMSGGGGGAPSIPAGGTASAGDGTTAPAGSTGGTPSSDTAAGAGSDRAGTSSTGTTGTGTAGSPTPPSTPGKSSSLGTHVVGADVQLAADTTAAPAGAKFSRADKEFIEEAASGGLTEVEVGKMMAERATHPGVKQFAEMLVKDHTQANEELRRIAASAGVSLPATPETKHRMMIERLANEKGAELDRTFIRQFGVKEHEKDVKDFRKQAEKGENPQLKAFAAKTLPKLQEHLAMAEKLESELGRK